MSSWEYSRVGDRSRRATTSIAGLVPCSEGYDARKASPLISWRLTVRYCSWSRSPVMPFSVQSILWRTSDRTFIAAEVALANAAEDEATSPHHLAHSR